MCGTFFWQASPSHKLSFLILIGCVLKSLMGLTSILLMDHCSSLHPRFSRNEIETCMQYFRLVLINLRYRFYKIYFSKNIFMFLFNIYIYIYHVETNLADNHDMYKSDYPLHIPSQARL